MSGNKVIITVGSMVVASLITEYIKRRVFA
jgi:hypothetical protein